MTATAPESCGPIPQTLPAAWMPRHPGSGQSAESRPSLTRIPPPGVRTTHDERLRSMAPPVQLTARQSTCGAARKGIVCERTDGAVDSDDRGTMTATPQPSIDAATDHWAHTHRARIALARWDNEGGAGMPLPVPAASRHESDADDEVRRAVLPVR